MGPSRRPGEGARHSRSSPCSGGGEALGLKKRVNKRSKKRPEKTPGKTPDLPARAGNKKDNKNMNKKVILVMVLYTLKTM